MAIINFRNFISILRSPVRECAFRHYVLPGKKRVPAFRGNIPIQWKCTHVAAVTEGEKRIAEIIKSNLNASRIEVEDISGGCGSMYRIFVASPEFKGKRTIQQHRIITNMNNCVHSLGPISYPQILENEVKDMHGLTIETTV